MKTTSPKPRRRSSADPGIGFVLAIAFLVGGLAVACAQLARYLEGRGLYRFEWLVGSAPADRQHHALPEPGEDDRP